MTANARLGEMVSCDESALRVLPFLPSLLGRAASRTLGNDLESWTWPQDASHRCRWRANSYRRANEYGVP